MTRERWEKLKVIFGDALDRQPAEREAFVREAVKDDPDLLPELLRLLEEYDRDSGLLSRPALIRARPLEPDDGPRFSPETVLARRFRIVRFIARGGMGEVYEAEDLELGERVALKAIRRHVAPDSELLPLFKKEIQLARRVTHPNVCRIFDLEQHEDADGGTTAMLLSMELLDGHTLSEHLRDQGPWSFRDALPLIEEMAAGLQAAHDLGIIHGDLKPGNVMLASRPGEARPRAVIMDFGLALPVALDSRGYSASRGGTPEYVAPEQAQGAPVTTATDVYSFALVIADMLGVPRPVRLKPGAERMPWRWSRALQRCLDAEPDRRLSRPAELARVLRESAGRRGRAVTWVAAAALIAALGIPASFFLAGRTKTTPAPELLPEAVPLTALPGVEFGPAISPDGRQVAFFWGKHEGMIGIYLKWIGSDTLTPLVTDRDNFTYSPAWSPDGETIAFLRRTLGNETWLYLISASGGPERRLARLARLADRGHLFYANHLHLSWTADRQWIYAPMSDGPDRRGTHRISALTGEMRRVTNSQEKVDIAPALSPNGRILAFVRQGRGEEVFRLNLTPDGNAEGPPQSLYKAPSLTSGLAWTP
ncbi:MAG: serine/threonine-protein kinase, partial [Acidobacteria bacterium]|nr:serine/threonine-protein kinase [Acidobacteriota bacterium]